MRSNEEIPLPLSTHSHLHWNGGLSFTIFSLWWAPFTVKFVSAYSIHFIPPGPLKQMPQTMGYWNKFVWHWSIRQTKVIPHIFWIYWRKPILRRQYYQFLIIIDITSTYNTWLILISFFSLTKHELVDALLICESESNINCDTIADGIRDHLRTFSVKESVLFIVYIVFHEIDDAFPTRWILVRLQHDIRKHGNSIPNRMYKIKS